MQAGQRQLAPSHLRVQGSNPSRPWVVKPDFSCASLQVSESRSPHSDCKNSGLSNHRKNCLDWQIVFLWEPAGERASAHPPRSSAEVPLKAALSPSPPWSSGDHSQSWLMTGCLRTTIHFAFPGQWPSHSFFFFPAWFLSATAGGYPAVGFPAATFTDAAVTAATPPVFAAPGPSNHPARAARPSPPTSHSR